jgi:hypothetical protein
VSNFSLGQPTLGKINFQRTHETALTGTVKGWKLALSLEEQIPISGTWRATETSIIVDWSDYKNTELVGERPSKKGKGWTESISIDKLNHYGDSSSWFSFPDWCSA